MKRFRFRTEAELRAIDQWTDDYGTAYGWGSGERNHLLGTEIPAEHSEACSRGGNIKIEYNYYSSIHYIEMTEAEIAKTKTLETGFIIHPVKEFKM